MAIDYRKTAGELVKELGGNENITNVTHCATRLRFILKNESLVDKDKVAKIPGVITTVQASGQFQVVIGNHVKDAYGFVTELVTIDENADSKGGQKVSVFSRIVDVISAIFAPFLYTLAACGILQGILGVLVALNAIDTTGGTYQILNFISWTAFTFLPVLIAVTASKKFGMNTFIAVVIACALVSPDYIAMVNAGEAIHFLGLPVQLLSYTSSVIPIILAVWAASYVEKFFEKHLPLVVRNLFTPMFTIAIMVPLTLLAFGPIGNTIGGAIGGIYNTLYDLSPIVAGIVVGGFWEVLVIFGVHWGITPVTVGNYASLGYDTFTGLQAAAVFSQVGAALGVFLKTKDKEMKGVSASAALTGLFGITEPAIYGVNLRLKKPMICGCIAGAVGGAIGGAFHAVSWGYNMPGIATLPAYFKTGHTTQFIGLLVSILVAFVLGAVLTFIVGFKEEAPDSVTEDQQKKEKLIKDSMPAVQAEETVESVAFTAPVTGNVISVKNVKDEAFASEAMGKGVGIQPEDGKVYAPFDGIAEVVFPTGHAVGLNDGKGHEFLIHIGLDTVELNGKGFIVHIQQGASVKKGDLLVEFDKAEIERAGYDSTVIYILTNTKENIEIVEGRHKALSDTVMRMR
ncbi:MAG: beta-glucoside-specific PTS transporter subunit IIABC [Faecalicatena sp.]|uniref:beta-glucoside-specific PTS transporter subunit IIABC n=1 Tax=Faecalicatena sp. TaxID=2005360 RepID=UPI00258DD43D|nr:beta-glucoside-specific PTS transporter subunit IIABC [Faecalicatena sp.]MCI6465079.1 beta-glucoside-specific PTS transporter subunit IIABC [Faecalicatena sp.]MDY5617090.1 beta-glucoside-specific PTS transporter subunit IIABC [Lachnospiraceae bacterium]